MKTIILQNWPIYETQVYNKINLFLHKAYLKIQHTSSKEVKKKMMIRAAVMHIH